MSGRCSATCATRRAWTRIRSRPTPGPDTGRRSWPNGWSGRRPAGDPEIVSQEPIEELIARSNRLGADPRNTNYAGGNTSAKGTVTDPVTRERAELLWVKGSGGDLGTLTADGLAVL